MGFAPRERASLVLLYLLCLFLPGSAWSGEDRKPSEYDVGYFTDADQLEAPLEQLDRDDPSTRGPCPTLDYSAHFQPIKDQDGQGLCWAFAGTALLEEQLCLQSPVTCGNEAYELSVFDASRPGWWFVQKDRTFGGGTPATVLQAALTQGICLDRDAPFVEGSTFSCSLAGLLHGRESQCLISTLIDVFEDWKKQTHWRNLANCRAPGENQKLLQLYLSEAAELQRVLPGATNRGVNFFTALTTSDSWYSFLSKILLSPACEKNRVLFNGRSRPLHVASPRLAGQSISNKAAALARALGTGRSAALGLCMVRFDKLVPCDSAYESARAQGEPVGHHLVVDGMRYNENSKQCEIQLRNSWGEGAPYNGWYPLSKIAPSMNSLTYLQEQ